MAGMVTDLLSLTIEQQHDAILRCGNDLLQALASATPINAVGQVRMELARLLHANPASEEIQINAPIRRIPVDERPALFQELSIEAAALRQRYSDHVGRWSLGLINEDLT
ncbi:hypothetical protein, partial [Sphingomonas sp. Mn802worker]|uniref:hypothetical protein n=1 Tax=Sphingomonas sp. Mn802worker TaxID=629773 RepID=UPI000562ECD6